MDKPKKNTTPRKKTPPKPLPPEIMEKLTSVTNTSDLNKMILSVVSMPLDVVRQIAKSNNVPVTAQMAAKFVTSTSATPAEKFKLLGQYIKTAKEEDKFDDKSVFNVVFEDNIQSHKRFEREKKLKEKQIKEQNQIETTAERQK